MSNCSSYLTSGHISGCINSSGGLKRALIANKSMIASFTPTIANDITGITSITMETNPLTSSAYTFFEFEPTKMSSNVVENTTVNMQNGSGGWEQVITLIFSRNEAVLRNQVLLMLQSDLVVIIEDFNGIYHFYGEFNGLNLTGGNSGSGTAINDLNGWNIVLTGPSPYPARTVTTDAITALGF